MMRGAGDPCDVVVVGAGICGVIFLSYARRHDLLCVALDTQDDVGGLWTWVPEWQDIQNRRQDFAVNDVPLGGVTQPHIHEHVREWVRRYDLDPHIELDCEVTSVAWTGDAWRLDTTRGPVVGRHLVVASGVQNEPNIPPVNRSDTTVRELHSSQLRRPEELEGRRVTVVGGGSSSWDLLDLAIEHGAAEIHWVYRRPLWFLPTGASKQDAWPNLRELAVVQTVLGSRDRVSRFLRWMLRKLYRWHGLAEIQPDEPFDIRTHQLIPGRRLMAREFDSISRHRDEVRSIEDDRVVLGRGERIGTDMLLWATGYRMNLGYLGLPEFDGVDSVGQLRPRLGSLVRSVDYPNLFFVGMSLTDSTSATPFFAAVEAQSIVAHILGKCEIPDKPIPHVLAYWDVPKLFASFDRMNYPRRWWKTQLWLRAIWYQLFRNSTVNV